MRTKFLRNLQPQIWCTDKTRALVSSETIPTPIYRTKQRHIPEVLMFSSREYLKANL